MIAGKAKQLLSQSGISGINSKFIFAYKIPTSIDDKGSEIQFLFTDISEYPDIEGSNKYRGYEQHLNLKIFFPIGYSEDFSVIQNKIIKFFRTKNIRFHDSSGVIALPDTDRLTMSMQFWSNEILDEAQ